MNTAAFLSYIFIAAFSPGPNNIMSMTNSAKLGFRKAFPYCIGAFFGVLGITALCAVFTSLLYQYIPRISNVLKWIGAGYMLYLAYSVFVDHSGKKGDKKQYFAPGSFLSGVVMQFVNPKLFLCALTALSLYILPFYQSVQALFLTAVVLAFTCSACISCWGMFGSLFQKLFQKYKKTSSVIMAALLIYCAVSSLI